MSYSAVIARIINIRKHDNADKLKLATVLGNQVIVGLDQFQEGELVVFFPSDGKLTDAYCEANDLHPRFNEEGTRINSGFIDPPKNRVRAQKFRGEKSEGLVMPLQSLVFTGITMSELNGLKEGYQFTEIGGVEICSKYETPATIRARKAFEKKLRKQIEVPLFLKHVDTEQFRYNLHSIPENSLITVTEKVHGTSGRIANTLVTKEVTPKWALPLPKLIRNLFTRRITNMEKVNGTRNVILFAEDRGVKNGFYGADEFRWNIYDRVSLQKFETIYFEICGWVNEQTPIQPAGETAKVNDKQFAIQFGEKAYYNYGCKPGFCRAFIYRITQTNEDGHVVELSWNQVKKRSKELGFEHVPEVLPQFLYTCDTETLNALIHSVSEGASILDETTWREGVVIRVDTPKGDTLFLKEKNFYFKIMEGIAKNTDTYVDVEEAS